MTKKLHIMLMMFILVNAGCAAKAHKTKTTATLKCMGSCEVEFPDGTKMKKGIITFPNIPLRLN